MPASSNRPRNHRWVYTGPHGTGTTTTSRSSSRRSSSSSSSSSTKMPPGVPHPDAGMPLGPYTARCECGGVTGICGTAQGAQKWRSHLRTAKHTNWDPLFN